MSGWLLLADEGLEVGIFLRISALNGAGRGKWVGLRRPCYKGVVLLDVVENLDVHAGLASPLLPSTSAGASLVTSMAKIVQYSQVASRVKGEILFNNLRQ